MILKVKERKLNTKEVEKLKQKAALFDELISFIEDKGLAYLMKEVENEKDIPLARAKKFFR